MQQAVSSLQEEFASYTNSQQRGSINLGNPSIAHARKYLETWQNLFQ
jgi:hypothetical protein